jgi:hypothetical protein
MTCTAHRHKRIHRLLFGPACLPVAAQSGAKQFFYSTVYYITLNSNCEAQRASKNLKKYVEDRVRSPKECMSDLSVNFLLFKGEKYV